MFYTPARAKFLKVSAAILFFLFLPTSGKSETLSLDLSKRFATVGITNGAALIVNDSDGITWVFSPEKLDTPQLPASTFKLMNSLIALETGVITSDTTVIPWDNVERRFPEWNQDQTLGSAMKYSVVWVYQRFAKEIGNERMLHYLHKSSYGNMKTGDNIETFWLNGNIHISMREQIEFLRNIAHYNLPFSRKNIDILHKVTIISETENTTLHGKTGWALRVKPNVG